MTNNKTSAGNYDFRRLEEKWRPIWNDTDLYDTRDDPEHRHIYILDFFPYPSGDGLSVGHCRNYIPTCVSARYHRMRGYNVLHPMGWDAFGLPAENYAVAHGIHPRETTRRFTANYRRQMQLVECSYDWSREINSTDPAYYHWTQWFFLLLYRRGLAYRASGSQWWCPHCRTILANEQVEHGLCWRCDAPVERKDLEQWYFKITAYADRLLADLDKIHWPERIKTMQRNWIGRSLGTEVVFPILAADPVTPTPDAAPTKSITVFTTRPDTLFGATFLVLAPEHELVDAITLPERAAEVTAYVEAARRKTEIDRLASGNDKSGVFTGAHARHPMTGEPVPIWVADYVLAGYGTGAIMGVPAHDARDYDFARRYGLPVIEVVSPVGEEVKGVIPDESEGIVVRSGAFSGLPSAEAGHRITAELAANSLGREQTIYRMRDWLISRQRYWGPPIPIIHCPECGIVPVSDEDLPVLLPDTQDFMPADDGRSPLARLDEWVNVPCPQCGGPAQRETDTMDGFACSSWYFLRFASPHDERQPFDPEAVRRWLPVDIYVGGAEHAVMHLLYARFWTKVMHDAGLIDFVEPFTELRNQGMMLSAIDGHKMSKSKGNVVTPDEVVTRYGTDVLRTFLLFLGPFDTEVVWDERGIVGVQRFLERYWNLARDIAARPAMDIPPDQAFERKRHQTIRRISQDMERFRFNTAVAGLMEYVNDLYAAQEKPIDPVQWRAAIGTLTQLLAPIAPFTTEEVWRGILGENESVHRSTWPEHDEALAVEEQLILVVQVNGKLRDRVLVPASSDDASIRDAALSNPKVRSYIGDRPIQSIIVVPGRLVNVVVA